MRYLDEGNRLCTLSDLKNVWLFNSSFTRVCLKAGFGPQLQALMIVMLEVKTSGLRHAGWEQSGWAQPAWGSVHIVWHSPARVAQRTGMVREGSRSRYSAASSAPKLLPPAEGTPADLLVQLMQRAGGIPSAVSLLLNPPYSDQALTQSLDI